MSLCGQPGDEVPAHAPAAANDLTFPGEPVAVARFIADVLHRAHQAAHAIHAYDEARAILGVAQLFAEDLAKIDPRLDRVQFVQAATADAA